MISNKIAKKMKKIHVELGFFWLKEGGGLLLGGASIRGNTVYLIRHVQCII